MRRETVKAPAGTLKRISACLLSLLLVISLLPVSVYSTGEKSDEIRIETTAQFLEFAGDCVLDTYSEGKTVRLMSDIDLSGEEFYGIPLFMGHFEGDGHTISGLALTDAVSEAGLFRQVLPSGVIENLQVAGTVEPAGSGTLVGGIAGVNRGEIRNCTFSGTVSGSRPVGGIAGENRETGLIDRCTVKGQVDGEHKIGGIAGSNLGAIIGSMNEAKVNTKTPGDVRPDSLDLSLTAEELIDITDVGGIVGNSTGTVRDCTNQGMVGYPQVGYNIGGIAGRQSGIVSGCTNRGDVFGRKDVGGIAGQLDPDAGWNFTAGGLSSLKGELDELHTRIDVLAGDAGAKKNAITKEISSMLDALERTGDATEALTDEAGGWLNENLDAVNDLAARIHLVLEGVTPISESLSSAAGSVADAGRDFSDFAEKAAGGLDAADPAAAALGDAIGEIRSAIDSAQQASEKIGEAIAHIKKGAELPEEERATFLELADGVKELSAAVSALEDRFGDCMNALDEILRSRGGADEAEIDRLRDSAASLREELEKISQILSTSEDAFRRAASAVISSAADPDLTELSFAINDLRQAFAGSAEIVSAVKRAAEDMSSAAGIIAAAEPAFSDALRALSKAAGAIGDAASHVHRAGGVIGEIASQVTAKGELSFTPINSESPAKDALFSSLDDVRTSLTAITAQADDSSLLGDLQAVSDQLFSVMNVLTGMLDPGDTKEDRELVSDISDGDTDGRAGRVTGCINRGEIAAETNVGGIVGAVTIDLSFDREDETNLSALLSDSARYLISAVIKDCVQVSSVTAKKENAGGIAGRMDFGLIAGCQASGVIASSGDCAGGIAGYSHGTIRKSQVRAELSAASHQGGIAGVAREIHDCLAMPDFPKRAEYQGSIAGDADGSVTGNYYAGNRTGGVNGYSFAGQAQEVSYEELLTLAEDDELFRTITVTFLAEGEVIEERTIDFGGSIESWPAVEDLNGKTWKWDDVEDTAIYRSITVEGRYVSPLTVLATAEDLPLYLVEGSFAEGQSLSVIPASCDPEKLGCEMEDVIESAALLVEGYHEPLLVKYRTQEKGTLYLMDSDGTPVKSSYTRDGSYIAFTLPEGGTYAYVREAERNSLLIPGIVLGSVVLIGAAFLTCRQLRRENC